MSDHKPLSPSKRHAWGNCPGYIRMNRGIPNKAGKAAEDGTRTHFVLEEHLKNPDKKLIKGMSYDCPQTGRFHLEQDRMDRVQTALDYVAARKKELGENCEVGAERWFNSEPAFGRDDMSGTADIIITNGIVLEVVDYKDGMTQVEAEDNEQMELYGIMALYEMVKIMGIPVETVRLTIIQPKIAFQGMTPITWWEMPADVLLAKIDGIKAEAAATDAPDAPCIAGEKQCKWCKAKGGCLEVNQTVMDAIGVGFQSVDIPAEVATVDPEKVSNDRLREMVQALPLLRQLAEVVEIEALRRFETGNPVKGLKCVRGRGSKTWAKDNEAIVDRLKKLKIPKDLCTKSAPITPTQALKIKWTNRKGEECTLSDRQKKILMDDYISVNEGKLKVVSENAPGKAITIDVASAFEPVIPEPKKEEIEIPDWMK